MLLIVVRKIIPPNKNVAGQSLTDQGQSIESVNTGRLDEDYCNVKFPAEEDETARYLWYVWSSASFQNHPI